METNYYQKIKKLVGNLAKVEKFIHVDSAATKIPKQLTFIKKINIMKSVTELSFFKKNVRI